MQFIPYRFDLLRPRKFAFILGEKKISGGTVSTFYEWNLRSQANASDQPEFSKEHHRRLEMEGNVLVKGLRSQFIRSTNTPLILLHLSVGLNHTADDRHKSFSNTRSRTTTVERPTPVIFDQAYEVGKAVSVSPISNS